MRVFLSLRVGGLLSQDSGFREVHPFVALRWVTKAPKKVATAGHVLHNNYDNLPLGPRSVAMGGSLEQTVGVHTASSVHVSCPGQLS